ncbi:lactonase family protein [Sphingomonas colocasiae]|uniref:Lactonase family protein n=1 Tax=Sphingomonas colocasiae TaxID=1848973 RepID=A0ABS7PS69_9SPHN|nr:lactonase family protein [Sphingomonas colocasiae]
MARPARSHPRRTAFVGCFTTQHRGARGTGISAYHADAPAWRALPGLAAFDNPSFLSVDARRNRLFCIYGDGRHASAFAIDPVAGRLRLINHASTGGLNGVHHALDPSGRFLIVANHDSGSLSLLPVGDDGALGAVAQHVDLPAGSGPRSEQFSAQPHQVVFDPSGRYLLVPAKGLDRVLVFEFDDARGRLRLRDDGHAAMRPGAGPRHLVFHPTLPVLFVVNEIECSLVLCGWNAASGSIRPLCLASTLPADMFAANTASAIVISPDGRSLYVSNRGHDSIAQFAFDSAAMRIRSVEWVPANGACPRFMMPDPGNGDLLVASEGEGRISAFACAPGDGRLSFRAVVAQCGSPSAIAFCDVPPSQDDAG